MKIVLLLAMSFLSGCGSCQRQFTAWTGEFTYKCSESGVQYIQSDSGIALHVDKDGKPIKCK